MSPEPPSALAPAAPAVSVTGGRRPVVALLGECMIELQGEAFGAMRQTFGGDTLNTAIYLARCGAAAGVQVRYVTALGDDRFSTGMLQRWQAEGVDTRWVRQLPGRLPGLYLIEVDGHGERHFSYWRDQAAARALFDADHTPFEDELDQVDWLYCSGISLAILPPAGRERLFGAMERLRRRGAHVAFDNNYRPRLWPDAALARTLFDRAYALADLAFVTLDDEGARQGDASLDCALALPCAELVVKRGAASTVVRAGGQPPREVPTEPVARVVDTTAAGDSFAAGYLAQRLAGAAPAAAAAFGNRLATRVIQHRGALVPRAAMADLPLPGLA